MSANSLYTAGLGVALAHLLIALSRVYPLSRRGLGYINDLRLSVSPSVRQSVIRLCPLSFSNIPLSETACRTHDSSTQTQGQGHSLRSWDLPSNIVSAPYLQPELPLFDGVGSSNIVFTCDEVELFLKALPIGKATGPDGINNCILRELAHELSPPLCSLLNQSLILGIVPDIWKEAHVCPIPKGGDRTAVSNYRPISLLSNINKVLERIVCKHLYNHFLENDILKPLQSGFIPGDSTVNQLLFLYNAFCKALDAGKEVRVIFCDISKAFDRVWHAGLIHKLRAAGISGNLLD